MSEQGNTPGIDPQKKNRRSLLVIFGIAFLSLGASYLLFYLTQGSGVWGTTNHGQFIEPPVLVSELQLVTEAGAPLGDSRSWWLLINARGQCGAPCEHALLQLRQLHVLLNKEASRVERALVTDGSFRADDYLAAYPNTLHLLQTSGGKVMPRGIYIVDPIGNLVFFYPLEDAGKPVLEDLKRLLKLSQIG